MEVKRGEMYYANLSPVIGEEEGGIRPVLIISNDCDNKNNATVIIAAISSRLPKGNSSVVVTFDNGGMFPSSVLLNQIRTIDKTRLNEYIGTLDDNQMQDVNKAISLSLGI